jgi:hypothetical protein
VHPHRTAMPQAIRKDLEEVDRKLIFSSLQEYLLNCNANDS